MSEKEVIVKSDNVGMTEFEDTGETIDDRSEQYDSLFGSPQSEFERSFRKDTKRSNIVRMPDEGRNSENLPESMRVVLTMETPEDDSLFEDAAENSELSDGISDIRFSAKGEYEEKKSKWTFLPWKKK